MWRLLRLVKRKMAGRWPSITNLVALYAQRMSPGKGDFGGALFGQQARRRFRYRCESVKRHGKKQRKINEEKRPKRQFLLFAFVKSASMRGPS